MPGRERKLLFVKCLPLCPNCAGVTAWRLAALERENKGINRDGFRKSHAEDAKR